MPFASNTWKLYVVLLLSASACRSVPVPNIRVYAQIPFVDGPEAAYVETVSKKEGIVPADEWAKKVPYMLMVDPEGWQAIEYSWLRACRLAKDNECEIKVRSIGDTIKKIDKIVEGVLRP